MRKLIYVPIINKNTDWGEIAYELSKNGTLSFREEEWKRHQETVTGFWDSIAHYFDSLDVENFKIYQDRLVANEEVALKIVSDEARKGNKNYEIISRLISRGACLVKTENFPLVMNEYGYLIKIFKARKYAIKRFASLNYRFHRYKLLRERDEFIAQTIDSTLGEGETGILFLGAHHEITPIFPEDINIIELKEREKINEYQKGFLLKKDRDRVAQLADYLVSPINNHLSPEAT